MNDSHEGQLSQPLFYQQPSFQDGRFSFIRVNDTIYYNEYIDRDFKSRPMPNSIRSNRNRAIVMMFVQMILSAISLVLYFRRRSRPILFIIVISFLLSLAGLFGVIKVNTKFHFLHAFFVSSILGAFYIYLLLEMFLFKPDSSNSNTPDAKLDDTWVLLLTSLPFLGIFIIGCHSMYLLNLIYDELQLRADQAKIHQQQQPQRIEFADVDPIVLNSVVPQNRQHNQIVNHPVLGVSYGAMQQNDVYKQFREREAQQEMHVLAIPENNSENKCIICLERKKDSVFYPCGHECVCNACGKEFMKIVRDKFCPVCRDRVKDLMKVYR